MKKKTIFRWIKILLVVYAVVGIGLYYLQEKLIFHPTVLTRDHQFKFDQPFRELNIPYNAQSNINIIQFTTDSTPKGVVLYFHGNRQNVERYAKFSEVFRRNGYEVWMMDYPGYGKSTSDLNEAKLYEWAQIFYKLARAKYPPEKIIIYGKSLGTGIAAQLASIRNCKELILETPYYSFSSIINQYFFLYPTKTMLHYKFPTNQYLKKVYAPIAIFHGTNDQLIRYGNSIRLKKVLKPGDEFITIDGAEHNDIYAHREYQLKMDSLLEIK